MEINNLLNIKKELLYFPKYSILIFTLFFLLFSFYYNYDNLLFEPPQSLHQWRQCDCLSITTNYYENETTFLEPKTHNLGVNGTGKVAGECPILYYGIAQLWKVFGKEIFIYRIITLLSFYLGSIALLKIFEMVLKHSILSIIGALILFTSPVIVFYANNFLMNLPALALALIALYLFFKFYFESKFRYLLCMCIVYAISGLLKIPSLLSFVAIVCLFILELFKFNFFVNKIIFKQKWITAFCFVMVILIQFTWYSYANQYNKTNQSNYFLIGSLPIWDMDSNSIKITLETIIEHINWSYFRLESQILFVFLFLFSSYYYSVNKLLTSLFLLLSTGFLAFILLFFGALKDHDYYAINLFIVIPVVILTALFVLKNKYTKVFTSSIFSAACFIFLLHNVDFAKRRMEGRYALDSWQNAYYHGNLKAFEELPEYLKKIGISKEDKIINISDNSYAISLYLMNHRGWTNFGIELDSSKIEHKIKLGAKYLIVSDSETLKKNSLIPFTSEKVGRFKQIEIYKLK